MDLINESIGHHVISGNIISLSLITKLVINSEVKNTFKKYSNTNTDIFWKKVSRYRYKYLSKQSFQYNTDTLAKRGWCIV